ncbi:winged helix-turn-helix transcriptional regulator [Paracoccus aerodenitrificans]|uniref:winged helix-turn-helix transcriptional regulator n=1 Tax=Paracoccus aerodenitrificans TaxID=3017781 RepID=UPI0022F0509F|nr:helix-turn-helix domain-containing protein [Paracoccus aerodenitrificans]WBU62973.1 helix-turn-helix domain-containing protein [Paracoccus aerodenitrificans]
MLGRLYENQDCSAARTLEIVGERWSLLILRDAMFRNYVRFSDFQRSLGIATNILAKRLDSFVENGLMIRQGDDDPGEPREYHLTEKGLALMPVIIALTEWGDQWAQPGPVEFRHATSGARIELRLMDTVKDITVRPDQIRAIRRQKV